MRVQESNLTPTIVI